MSKPYKLIGDSIVETNTHHVVFRLTLPQWESTLNFELKVRNGEIVPKWVDVDGHDTLIFVPPSMA